MGIIQPDQLTGHIQVNCDPEVRIFLDDEYKGDTERELGGLVIKDVVAGEHRLKAVKSNFQPQIKIVKVSAGGVLVYTLKPFIPKIKITEEGKTGQADIKRQVSTLIIQSLPVECEMSIPQILTNEVNKKSDRWVAENIPSGKYRAIFKAIGKEIPYEFEIVTGQVSHLMVDFISEEVKDIIKSEARAKARMEQVTDIKDNNYKIVRIGNQVWMAENLKVTHYRNGDPIPTGLSSSSWKKTKSGAYAVYGNEKSNADTYGYSYNWYAVDDSRGLAPEGWHIPTDDEWKKMELHLGKSQSEADDVGVRGTNEGGKLKEDGTTHWASPNTGATNENDFTALPGGYRASNNGNYYDLGVNGYFWSSTEYGSYYAWYRKLNYNNSEVSRYNHGKGSGFSVRCVRD